MGGGEEREGKILEERDRPEEKDARKRRVVCSRYYKQRSTTYSRLLGGDRYRISALQGILLQLDHAIIILIRVFIGSTLRLPTD